MTTQKKRVFPSVETLVERVVKLGPDNRTMTRNRGGKTGTF